MAGNDLNHLITDALFDLHAGRLLEVDKKILALTPLPSETVEPYSSQRMDALNTMNITYSALCTWIAQAKNCSYFEPQFVQLSGMIRNGITTMGRGLISLHQQGQDLSIAPMSMDELLDVASYHFRKSYLGVMQTVQSHPEISTRLLNNQLQWANILMRLFKTEEKLKQKPELPAVEAKVKKTETAAIEGKDQKPLSSGGFTELTALTGPAAFSGHRAFRGLSGESSSCGDENLMPADLPDPEAISPAENNGSLPETEQQEFPKLPEDALQSAVKQTYQTSDILSASDPEPPIPGETEPEKTDSSADSIPQYPDDVMLDENEIAHLSPGQRARLYDLVRQTLNPDEDDDDEDEDDPWIDPWRDDFFGDCWRNPP